MWFVYAMLGNVLWSVSDVVASMVMNRFERSGVMTAWFFSALQLIPLGILYVLFPIEHVRLGAFALAALASYLATLSFFQLLQHVDVSVSSVAWVFLSIAVALGGVFLFGDTWTPLQGIGAIMSVSGALGLALWHKRIDRLRTCVLICLTGFLYAPSFLVQKSAYLAGVPLLTVFFWMLFFFDVFAFSFPLTQPKYRKRALPFLCSLRPLFIGLISLWIFLSMISFFVVANAYKLGDASLVGVAENGQPFFLMLFAWIAALIAPKYAPKEILTAQTTGVKIVTFFIVFAGLGLLVV